MSSPTLPQGQLTPDQEVMNLLNWATYEYASGHGHILDPPVLAPVQRQQPAELTWLQRALQSLPAERLQILTRQMIADFSSADSESLSTQKLTDIWYRGLQRITGLVLETMGSAMPAAETASSPFAQDPAATSGQRTTDVQGAVIPQGSPQKPSEAQEEGPNISSGLQEGATLLGEKGVDQPVAGSSEEISSEAHTAAAERSEEIGTEPPIAAGATPIPASNSPEEITTGADISAAEPEENPTEASITIAECSDEVMTVAPPIPAAGAVSQPSSERDRRGRLANGISTRVTKRKGRTISLSSPVSSY